MKKRLLNIGIFIILLVIAVLNSYYFTHLYSFDEIWNYGFAVNINRGLVPYRDFNMIIGPVFPYLLSIILKIFGEKLIVYHIVIAFMVTLITYLASKKIKFYSILIYIAMLIYSTNGYNTSTLLWLFIILFLLDKDDSKYNDIIIPIIVSIMAFTKQTLILLAIPSLLYSKNKKKTFLVYIMMVLSFLVYLIANNNLWQFLDYCVFGMFDFAGDNALTIPIFLIFEIVIVIGLIITLIKSKGQRKDVFYVLLYQVMALPILEIYHFVLGWSAVIYIIFQSKKSTTFVKNSLFIVLIFTELYFLFATNTVFTIRDRMYFENYPNDTYLKGRLVPDITKNYIATMKEYIETYNEHDLYIFSGYSYLVKLELDIPVNKFDLINNGNMGYNGAFKYLEEIKTNCSKNKCMFFINDNELKTQQYNQTNKDILRYVITNNKKIYASSVFCVYINEE